MPPVFEKLAEQLREPLFRTAESGYDPMDVRAFLDEIAARLAVLEARVAKAEARAEKSQRRLAAARRFARSSSGSESIADAGVLDEVVMAGQRRAEELVEAAELEAVRLREEGVARAAAARASTDVPDVRAQVDEAGRAVRGLGESVAARRDDLDVAARSVKATRKEVLNGIERELSELAAMPFLVKEARS